MKLVRTDPLKLAMLRVGNTLRTECIASGACDVKDYAFKNFSRFFLKNYEHTFGKVRFRGRRYAVQLPF